MSTEISDYNGILRSLNARISCLKSKELHSLDALGAYITDLSERSGSFRDLTFINTLNEICKKSLFGSLDEELEKRIKQVKASNEILSKEERIKRLYYANLLKDGKKMLVEQKATKCPLCECDINREDVINNIDKNLLSLDAISKRALEMRENCSYISSEFLRIKSVLDEMHSYMKLCENDFLEEIISMNKIFNDLDNLISDIEETKNLEPNIQHNNFGAVMESVAKFSESARKKAKEIIQRSSSFKNEDLFHFMNLLKEIEAKYSELRKVEGEINQYTHYYSICEKILSAFSAALKHA